MAVWLSLLVPPLVMVAALGMERFEARMLAEPIRRDELDDLIERARPREIRTLSREGIIDIPQGAPGGAVAVPCIGCGRATVDGEESRLPLAGGWCLCCRLDGRHLGASGAA
jgi:hypothetical protein